MTSSERKTLSQLVAILEQESRYHSSTFTPEQLELVRKLATTWDSQYLFPILDLLRLVALHPHAAEKFFPRDLLAQLAHAHLEPDSTYANQLMVLRLFCNLFRFGSTRSTVGTLCLDTPSELFDQLDKLCFVANKNIQVTLSTLILNLTVSIAQGEPSLREQCLMRIANLLFKMSNSVTQSDDSLFRIVVALGTGALIEPSLLARVAAEFAWKSAEDSSTSEATKSALAELKKLANGHPV